MQIPFSQLQEALEANEYIGFCLACGAEQDGCEADARDYVCEVCEAHKVYGAQEILMMEAYSETE